MKDAFGVEIHSLDGVVWTNRKGASQWLSKGVVVEAYADRIIVERTRPIPSRRVTLKHGPLVAVVDVSQ